MTPALEIKFYYAPGACSLAPHILLHEVGAEYKPMPFEIGAQGTNITEEFAAVNPKLKVPTLSLSSLGSVAEIITESPAVCTVIAGLAPEKNFMGKEGIERVRVLEWFNYLSGTLHGGAFGHLFRPERFTIDSSEKALEAVRTKAKENITTCFEYVEGRLREGKWAVGEGFTGVDAFLLVFWRWGSAYGFGMERYGKYQKLMGRLVERKSVKEVLKLEGIKAML